MYKESSPKKWGMFSRKGNEIVSKIYKWAISKKGLTLDMVNKRLDKNIQNHPEIRDTAVCEELFMSIALENKSFTIDLIKLGYYINPNSRQVKKWRIKMSSRKRKNFN